MTFLFFFILRDYAYCVLQLFVHPFILISVCLKHHHGEVACLSKTFTTYRMMEPSIKMIALDFFYKTKIY